MTTDEPAREPADPDAAAAKRVYETRWWLWGIAVVTLVAIVDFRWHVENGWDALGAGEGVAGVAGLVIVCRLWRGRIVQGILLIAAALAVFSLIRQALGR